MRLIDEILSDSNIDRAILQVKRNKGASGVDKMTVDELDEYFYKHRREIRCSILNRKYKPQSVKRVYIPKPNGKKRPLGIPTVVDRVIQQAVAQVLMKKLDSSFSEFSYGFRPRRSAQMAVLKTLEYINEGYDWVIDLDIEAYFDTFGQWLRHKIRVIILKQWKIPKRIYINLQKLNKKLPCHFTDEQIYSVANSRLGLYRQACGHVVNFLLSPRIQPLRKRIDQVWSILLTTI